MYEHVCIIMCGRECVSVCMDMCGCVCVHVWQCEGMNGYYIVMIQNIIFHHYCIYVIFLQAS